MVTVESVVPEISNLVREYWEPYYLKFKVSELKGGNSTQTKFILMAILVTD